MNEYVVLEQLRAALNTGEADTEKDFLLRTYATLASGVINREAGRVFYPRVETRSFNVPETGRKLMLDDDLQSVTAFTNGDDSAIEATEYVLHPANETPKYAIELRPGSNVQWYLDSANKKYRLQALGVEGVWCWHDQWSLAWDSVELVKNSGGINAAVTTLTIADYDGADSYGFSPAISQGKLLKIGTEYLYVVSISEETGGTATVTVIRGVNGSTAAIHDEDAAISVFRPATIVYAVTLRLALFLYKQRTAGVEVDRPAVTADGVTVLPMQLPKDVQYYISLIRRVQA